MIIGLSIITLSNWKNKEEKWCKGEAKQGMDFIYRNNVHILRHSKSLSSYSIITCCSKHQQSARRPQSGKVVKYREARWATATLISSKDAMRKQNAWAIAACSPGHCRTADNPKNRPMTTTFSTEKQRGILSYLQIAASRNSIKIFTYEVTNNDVCKYSGSTNLLEIGLSNLDGWNGFHITSRICLNHMAELQSAAAVKRRPQQHVTIQLLSVTTC